MNIDYSPRRSGKTERAIKKSSETGAVIVCFDFNKAQMVALRAKEMGLTIPHPVPFLSFFHTDQRGIKGLLPRGSEIIIDDVEVCLASLLWQKYEIATISMSLSEPDLKV